MEALTTGTRTQPVCGAGMKRVTMASIVKIGGRELGINSNADKGQGCYVEILERIAGELNAMLSHHSRVLVIRLDFHLHDYTPDNKPMTRFFRKLKKRLGERYGLSRVGHVWVRERERAKAQHYHVAIMLDGNTVQHPNAVITLCRAIWEAFEHPVPYTPKDCFYLVSRGDTDAFLEMYYRLSYMAKERGKGYKAPASNDYSTSRIKVNVGNSPVRKPTRGNTARNRRWR